MSTLIVRPLSPPEEPGAEVIQLDILAKSQDFAGFFDQLEIWRSFGSDMGPFAELTADSWMAARLPLTGGDRPAVAVVGASAALVGKTLVFLIQDKDTVAITFTGTDPLTRATAASQIESQSGGKLVTYVDTLGQLVVETPDTGTNALLQCTGGTAAGDLSISVETPDNTAYGRDARMQLRTNTEVYRFTDQRGKSDAFYRTRYRNRTTQATSDFSQSFGTGQVSGLTDASLVLGQLDLVDMQGRPISGRQVRIHTNFNGVLVEGKLMAGTDLVGTTDRDGHVEFMLVRGQSISVAVVGTDLIRTFTVPVDLTVLSFQLLDPTLSTNDVFRVQVPTLVYAERRTL